MRNAYIYLHISVLLAGFTGIFGKLIDLNEALLVWYRIALATVLLWIILYIGKDRIKYPMTEVLSMSKSGCILTLHWLFFFASIKHSNVSIGVVCFGLTSFFTAILQPLIRRKRLVFSELMLSMLTMLGIALIFHFDTQYRLGITLGVISAVFSALYTIFNEELVQKYESKLLNFYQLGAGTLFLGAIMPVYLHFNPTNYLFPTAQDWIYTFILAFLCTVVLYVLFNLALKKLSAFTVSLSFNLEPIYSIVLAFILFKENQDLNHSFYIGISLVMLSVILQAVSSYKSHQPKAV